MKIGDQAYCEKYGCQGGQLCLENDGRNLCTLQETLTRSEAANAELQREVEKLHADIEWLYDSSEADGKRVASYGPAYTLSSAVRAAREASDEN